MKCAICGQKITIGSYRKNDWEEVVHAYHQIEHCYTCGRFVTTDKPHLPDNRIQCGFCEKSIVKDSQTVQWAEKQVMGMLQKVGIGFDKCSSVPVEIVSPSKLAELRGSKDIDINQRGLTKTKCVISLLGRKSEYRIYILDYLPKVVFAGVLAHELLHVWLIENDINKLSPAQTEGFCNMGSYLVYSSIQHPLAEYLEKQLFENPSPVYGEGYRAMKRYYDRYGWNKLIYKITEYK